jgi:Cu/Ag efflux pump CusA
MMPLAWGFGSGADMLRPLAIAVIGALCISVLLSLIATPTVYSLLRGGHTSDNDGDVFHDAPQVIESELIS